MTAGAGFGKSVLLAEAMAENALAPRGVDVLVACTGADRSPAHFLRRIADAAELDGVSGRIDVDRVTAGLARRWPLGVCLFVDDAHHVGGYPEGARLLSRLVTDAPPAVHVVLASRRQVRGLARARLGGEVLDIGAADLSLSDAETVELARLHDVDPAVVASAGGWPAAAAMAAAYGIGGAEEYVFEAVLDHLGDSERTVLATAAAIGSAHPAILRRAVGDAAIVPEEVLDGLPLVRRSASGELAVHDLWRRVVDVDSDDVTAAVGRAVDAFVADGQFDRAFGLCAARGDWHGAAAVLTTCCRRGHVEVRPDVVVEWLELLPATWYEEPAGLLLRGLAGRVDDTFGQGTAELLARAVDGFRAAGNVAGEVAAGVELVYVLRNQGRCEELAVFLARAVELAETGHPEAAGPAAVARALVAELHGDDREMVRLLDAIPSGSLSRELEAMVAMRRAICTLIIGDEVEMLASAERCARMPAASCDRHVLALAKWFAAEPRLALDTCGDIIDEARHTRVAEVFLGTLATTLLASSGRITEADDQLARTERAASGTVGLLLTGALAGVRALVAAARGDDEHAGAVVRAELAEHPLDDPLGWRRAVRWLPLAYVLVPSTREALDRRDLGVVHARRLDVARAVADAREGRRPAATTTPTAVATAVPLPWAMILAARLCADGAPLGRQIAEYLLDLHGMPARDAVRAAVDHPVRQVALGAKRLLATIAVPPAHPVRIELLGPLVLRLGDDGPVHEHWKRERVRSLLLYLVLHGAAHREQIIEALWPHLEPDAADRNLRVTLTYLHQVLEPPRRNGEAPFLVRQHGSTLSLAGRPHLEVDLDELTGLLDRADDADHRGLPSEALDLLEQATALWRGPCLADGVYEEWAAPTCRDVTARLVVASVRAAEIHLAAGRVDAAVRHARRALAADQWCETAYQALIAAALARGDRSGALRLLDECDRMLAELGIAVGEQTEMLRRRLATPRRLTA